MPGWSLKKAVHEAAPEDAVALPSLSSTSRDVPTYDPHLLIVLEAQHRAILRLIDLGPRALQAGNFDGLKRQLMVLEHVMSEHLAHENVRLYPYLAHRLRGDPALAEMVELLHLETGCIGNAVVAFVSNYTQAGITERNATEFFSRAAEILAFLRAHFTREESDLYSLYRSLPRTDPSPPRATP